MNKSAVHRQVVVSLLTLIGYTAIKYLKQGYVITSTPLNDTTKPHSELRETMLIDNASYPKVRLCLLWAVKSDYFALVYVDDNTFLYNWTKILYEMNPIVSMDCSFYIQVNQSCIKSHISPLLPLGRVFT